SCRPPTRCLTSTCGWSRCRHRSVRLGRRAWANRPPSLEPPRWPTLFRAPRACVCERPQSTAGCSRGPAITTGRRGSPLRSYVARALPNHSPIIVSNRGPNDPRPDGTMKRGAGGVITGLLSLAEATGAHWVACARSDAERHLAARQPSIPLTPLVRSGAQLHYATPTREQY